MLRVYTFLQSLALAVLLTWPMAAHLSTAAVGSADADGLKHLWNLWWMHKEAWDGTWGLLTTWVGFPKGTELYPIEPLNAPFAALWPGGPIPLSNLLALLHLTLTGWCACWLGWLVTRDDAGAHTAGALAQSSAFAAYTLHVGVGELRQLWWLPLGLGCLMQAQRTGRWRWFAALGTCLSMATLSCFYLGFFLALAVLVYALLTLREHHDLFVHYAVTAVLAAVVVLIPFRSFARTYDPLDDRSLITFDAWVHTRERPTYERDAVQPSDLLTWRNAEPAAADRGGVERQTFAYTGGRYLGALTLLLALIGVAAAPRVAGPWIGVAAAGTVLSFGSVLWEGGRIVTVHGNRLVLPLGYLNQYLGYYAEAINFPARFLAVPAVALAVAGAVAVARWRWALALVPLACADMVAHDRVPWPRSTFLLPDTRGLAADGGDGGVLNVTPFLYLRKADATQLLAYKNPEGRAVAIAAQIALDRRFDIVPIERMDVWASGGLLWALPLTTLQEVARSGASTVDAHRRDLFLLRDRGFDTLLLTFTDRNADVDRASAYLTSLCGPPRVARVAEVWTVPEVEATDEEAAAWRDEHAAAVRLIRPPHLGVQFPHGGAPAGAGSATLEKP